MAKRYKVEFTCAGEIVQTWHNFESYGAAHRAIRDADLCIPFNWDWTISESEGAAK